MRGRRGGILIVLDGNAECGGEMNGARSYHHLDQDAKENGGLGYYERLDYCHLAFKE